MLGPIHFLHIRKTGGNALKAALDPLSGEFGLILHDHETTLADVPAGERVAFILRDPIERFMSGFNSRLRQGRPLKNSKWRDGEVWAFSIFKTPNDLAEALSSEAKRADALRAMGEIAHVNTSLADWLRSLEYLQVRSGDIAWAGRTETLTSDFEKLKERIGLPASLALPDDPVAAHRTPDGFSQDLSAVGRANIAAWYQADRQFLAWAAHR